MSSPPGTISLQTEITFNLSLRSISCDQHRRLFHLCSIFISKSNVQALTPNPPTAPSAAGWRRMGGRLWRGKGRSCSWCHNGWSCATTSCVMTSVSNTSWRWETWRRAPPKFGRWRHEARGENRCLLSDSVQLRVGWPLRAPGPGKGREGAAETLHAASATVSDCTGLSTPLARRVDDSKDKWLIRRDLSIWAQEVQAWPLKGQESAGTETELLFCSVLINESIQRLKRNHCSRGGGDGGGGYCTVCYAMNYECMTLLILKSWETKNRSTSVSNTVENEQVNNWRLFGRFYNGNQSSVQFAKLRT